MISYTELVSNLMLLQCTLALFAGTVDEMGVDKIEDEMGVEEIWVDEIGVDKLGSRRSGMIPVFSL